MKEGYQSREGQVSIQPEGTSACTKEKGVCRVTELLVGSCGGWAGSKVPDTKGLLSQARSVDSGLNSVAVLGKTGQELRVFKGGV